jgi:small subunit ribosomal protein S16
VAVRLRLTRVGSRKNPIWRVVVADGRSKRDGRVLETVGRYNPQLEPSEIVLDRERIDHWLARGAQPSDTVRKLILATDRGAPPARAAKRRRTGAARGEAAAPARAEEAPIAEGGAAAGQTEAVEQPEAAERTDEEPPAEAEDVAQSGFDETGPASVEVPAQAE